MQINVPIVSLPRYHGNDPGVRNWGSQLCGAIESWVRQLGKSSITEFQPGANQWTQTAAGSTQLTASTLVGTVNVFTTVAPGAGTILPTVLPGGPLLAGDIIEILNRGANTLSVYPPVGQMIETLAVNAPAGIFTNSGARYLFVGGGQWYVLP